MALYEGVIRGAIGTHHQRQPCHALATNDANLSLPAIAVTYGYDRHQAVLDEVNRANSLIGRLQALVHCELHRLQIRRQQIIVGGTQAGQQAIFAGARRTMTQDSLPVIAGSNVPFRTNQDYLGLRAVSYKVGHSRGPGTMGQTGMHGFLHIVTDTERVVDPDGQQFESLRSAVGEARQCACDLMAEELRQGRPLPLNWRVQVVDDEGCVLATLNFGEIIFGGQTPTKILSGPAVDPDLVERAKAIFFKAQRTQSELRNGLLLLCDNVRVLSKLTGSF